MESSSTVSITGGGGGGLRLRQDLRQQDLEQDGIGVQRAGGDSVQVIAASTVAARTGRMDKDRDGRQGVEGETGGRQGK